MARQKMVDGVVRNYTPEEEAAADANEAANKPTAAKICAAVDRLAKDKRNAVVSNISAAEMASWPIKRAEALAFTVSGLATDAPTLNIEAAARGITLAALVAKVLAKAALFTTLEAQIAGTCGKHQDAVALLPLTDIAAYDITTGWPA